MKHLISTAVAAALALGLTVSCAAAQLKRPAITGNIGADIRTDLRGGVPTGSLAGSAATPLGSIMDQIEAVKAEFVAAVIADIQEADKDAAQLTNPNDPTSFKDPISHTCYPAAIKFLQSLPTATPTVGDRNLVQLFQKKRDLIAQIQAGLPTYLKIGCAPLIGDEVHIVVSLLGLVGVKIGAAALTGLFPALAPLTLPAAL